jgi:hypothetical protein
MSGALWRLPWDISGYPFKLGRKSTKSNKSTTKRISIRWKLTKCNKNKPRNANPTVLTPYTKALEAAYPSGLLSDPTYPVYS